MTPIVFGIKNCDTIKKARRWLEQQEINYTFHDFRKDGLETTTVAAWLDNSDVSLDVLANRRSTTWKQLSDDEKLRLETDPAALLTENPTLIKRPVLVVNDKIHIGFSEANYTSIFNEENS